MLLNFPKKSLKKMDVCQQLNPHVIIAIKQSTFLTSTWLSCQVHCRILRLTFQLWPASAWSQQRVVLIWESTGRPYSQNNAVVTLGADSNEKEDSHSWGQPSWPQHSSCSCVTLFFPLRYDLNSFLSFLCGGVMIQTQNKKASCETKQSTRYFSFLG